MIDTVEKALALAGRYHDGQEWNVGVPYVVGHLVPVVSLAMRIAEIDGVDPIRTGIVAAFHDSIEDTEATRESLLADGVDPELVAAIEVLTFDPDRETRREYMIRVATSPIPEVRPTKKGDDLFNSDPVNLAIIALNNPGRANRMEAKYRRDRAILAEFQPVAAP